MISSSPRSNCIRTNFIRGLPAWTRASMWTLRMQPGYDHSYYFIQTFMGDHLAHHAKYLDTAD